MSLHIKRPWWASVGALLLGSTPFWHFVGRVSDVDFLIDAGTWIGPRAMGFVSSWGWLIAAPLGVVVLYLALRAPSVKKAHADETVTEQEKPEVPEKATPAEEETFIMPIQTPFPLGTGIVFEDSPRGKAWGNISIDNDRGFHVKGSPETELWDNLVIGPQPPNREDDRGAGGQGRKKRSKKRR